ncbi:MAG: DotU family type IV/VI secretion system protein [Treponema sp.]|jgi:type VI protein secretion system component VasF|nr:DotU family type IV/VI secretion system protein [Treponema sp.]
MSAPVNIEELCRPVLGTFCNYWQLNQAGSSPSMGRFRQDIEASLEDAKRNAAADPALDRDYERIERPLVFFIDFMVKEGNFPFSRDWQELGRNYNELSGDEKFFNLLSDALKDNKSHNTLPLFYTMLGLGFEGAYSNDRGYIEKTMQECASRFPGEFDIRKEPIVKVAAEKRLAGLKKSRVLQPLRVSIVLSLFLLAVSLIVNFTVFFDITRQFRKSLSDAATAAQRRGIQTIPQEIP